MLTRQQSRGPLIYVVDDDLDVRDSTAMLVQSLGWATQTHPSAETFLAGYEPGNRQHCLILDLILPGMTGVELQTELRARGIGVPVIAMTVDERGDLATRAKEAGALAVIGKPFRQQTLEPLIRQALGLTGLNAPT